MEKLRNVARFGKYGKRLCMMFLFLCITTSGLMRASVFAQTTVTAKFRNVTLNEVLWEIQKQTDFTFIYSTNDAKKVRVENLDVKNELISEVLNKCLRNSGLTYTVHDGESDSDGFLYRLCVTGGSCNSRQADEHNPESG